MTVPRSLSQFHTSATSGTAIPHLLLHPPTAFHTAYTMPAPIKIGFVGYGRAAGIFHLPFVANNPNFHVYAFYQRSARPVDGSKHCSVDYPNAKHYQDLDNFLADPEIDLVSVVTRHDTHAEFAERALLAGKHGSS